MRRLLACLLICLSAATCAPAGYHYKGPPGSLDSFTKLEPDNPAPSTAPSPAAITAPMAPAPAPVASSPVTPPRPVEERIPIERGAVLYRDSPDDLDLINKLALMVRTWGYRCESVSAALPQIFAGGFALTCNHFRYDYSIQDKGGQWIVTVE